MGTNFAGPVAAVGPKVLGLKPCDAVVGTVAMRGSATFAPWLITPRDPLVKKPDNLSFAKPACLRAAGRTVWLVLLKHAGFTRAQKLFKRGRWCRRLQSLVRSEQRSAIAWGSKRWHRRNRWG